MAQLAERYIITGTPCHPAGGIADLVRQQQQWMGANIGGMGFQNAGGFPWNIKPGGA
jgi:hypothetical protein